MSAETSVHVFGYAQAAQLTDLIAAVAHRIGVPFAIVILGHDGYELLSTRHSPDGALAPQPLLQAALSMAKGKYGQAAARLGERECEIHELEPPFSSPFYVGVGIVDPDCPTAAEDLAATRPPSWVKTRQPVTS